MIFWLLPGQEISRRRRNRTVMNRSQKAVVVALSAALLTGTGVAGAVGIASQVGQRQ